MRLTAAGTPNITGRLSVATARDAFTDAVARAEWMEHIRAGRAFGGFNTQPAVVGQFSRVMLSNPAANTKRLLVAFASGQQGVAGRIRFGVRVVAEVGGSSNLNLLRQAGAALSTGLIFIGSNAVVQVSGVQEFDVAALAPRAVGDGHPFIIELAPDTSAGFEGRVVNTEILGNFLWAEV